MEGSLNNLIQFRVKWCWYPRGRDISKPSEICNY